MRYSRFKKQMDGTAGVRRPRNPAPASPRKNRVEKNRTQKKVKDMKSNDAGDKIKAEAGEEVGSSQETVDGPQETAVLGLGLGLSMDHVGPNLNVKKEPAMRPGDSMGGAPYPLTPGDSHAQSETPSPGFGGAGDMSDMDEMMASFEMPGQAMYHHPGSMTESNHHGYPIEMHMGLGVPYEDMWQQPQASDAESVLVKAEPRWDETYRHSQA